MKKTGRLPLIFAAALAVMLLCAACAESVKVTVHDKGMTFTAEGNDGMTVGELLENADVKVGINDRVTPDRNKKWKEATEDEITVLRYTSVTVTDGEKTQSVNLIGGTVEQAIAEAGFDKNKYDADAALTAPLKEGMTITLTKVRDGLMTEDGKLRYYIHNELQKNAVVPNGENSFFYANDEGTIDKGYCDGVTVDGKKWNVINGEAYEVDGKSDETLHSALKAVAKCTDSSMKKKDKLKKCFNYVKTEFLEGSRRKDYTEPDWPIVYANDLFKYGKGDCYSYAAAFAYMARGIGYTEVYACNSGGHGWAEIDKRIYDPEWSNHRSKYSYYGMKYTDEVDVAYAESINDSIEWMHVKIDV